MVLKRFKYKNGLDVIAPLKCGTRWLENKTNPISIEELSSYFPITGITNKTYWVYRDGMEHLLSALKTEIRDTIEFNDANISIVNGEIKRIVNSFIIDKGTHWSNKEFTHMYGYWNKIEFKPIELNKLSNLFPGVEFDKMYYNMNYYHKTNEDIDVTKLIPKEELDMLFEFVKKDGVYLDKMLRRNRTII